MQPASNIGRKWSRHWCQTGQVLFAPRLLEGVHRGPGVGGGGGLNQECTEHNHLIQICKKIAVLYMYKEGGGRRVHALANL